MRPCISLPSSSSSFQPPVIGVNLLFLSNAGVCDTSKDDHLACSRISENTCYSSVKLFCETFLLEQMGCTFDHYAMGEGSCRRNDNYGSAQDQGSLRTCIGLPKDVTNGVCSSYWDSPLTQDRIVEGNTMECQEPGQDYLPRRVTMREIHLPNGTFRHAARHHWENNFRALGSFPAGSVSNTKSGV